jgi:hypothetical protein
MLGIVQMLQLKQYFFVSFLFAGMTLCAVFAEVPATLPVVRKNHTGNTDDCLVNKATGF